MKHYEITKPIGLTTPCKEIESTCSKAHMYKRCGLRPKHYIIPLDSGSGRTTLVEYMTDMYKEAGVLNFSSGLDDYIEIAFDGTLQQLKQAFSAIDSAAVYTNEYCNISRDNDNDVAARIFSLISGTPKEKRSRVMEACNVLNQKIRYTKFYVDSDGNINVEYDFPMHSPDDGIGEMALELSVRAMKILNSEYGIFMKAL